MPIHYEVQGDVAVLTINRPEKANALTAADKEQLAVAVNRAGADHEVAGIVLTGAGRRHFCAGSDVAELPELDVGGMVTMLQAESAAYRSLMNASKPVVAAVGGLAFGTGLLLVICTDYAVAARHATFAVPELNVGACTPLEGVLLPWVVGLGWARALYYGPQVLDSGSAQRLGIVHEVAAESEVLPRSIEMARKLAGAGKAFSLQKQWMLQLVLSGDGERLIAESLHSGADQLVSGEVTAAVTRFLARRHG